VADSTVLFSLGFTLIIVGVLVLVVSGILIVVMQGRRGGAKAAGVIIVGPVPIVFGSDKKVVKPLLTLSILLTVLLIVGMLIYYFLLR
jgi:uncharacterized protein (TIGR00304 family)